MPISQERKREAQANAKRLQDGAQMLRNPKLLETLDEFEDSPDSRRQAAGNPKQFLKGKGVQVPDEYSVELVPDNWFLGISFNSTRIFGYNSSSGWCFFC